MPEKYIAHVEQVFLKCGTETPFKQANVQEWLGCSKFKATSVMNAMKVAEVIQKVTGLGPGKYKFIEL